MKRNYRNNNRSHYRSIHDNQTVDNVDMIAETNTNITSNIEANQSIEQAKEIILANTTEDYTKLNGKSISEANTPEIYNAETNMTELNKKETNMAETNITEMINKITLEEDFDESMNDTKAPKVDLLENENQKEVLSNSDRDIIIINKERYDILASEHFYIFHPEYFGISPTWANDPNFQYKCFFELKDNQLYLKSFQVTSDRGYPIINQVKPEICNYNHGLESVQYINLYEPLKYSGAIMFANTFVKDYRMPNHIDMFNPPCFSYKFVGEMIFDEGKLITSVNHNKAMRRIRKNIDLGLRSLDKRQDIKCIKKFVKFTFIGDYRYQDKKQKRNWKEKSKNNNIINKEVHIMESGKKRYMDKIRQHLKMFGTK